MEIVVLCFNHCLQNTHHIHMSRGLIDTIDDNEDLLELTHRV